MAITLDDFNKIWASTSPLTPYSFSDANYKKGWNFVGATPPSRQMWDFLQKNNDEKMQYLADNYLPLSGGTMTGNIGLSATRTIQSTVDNSTVYFRGGSDWDKGAYLELHGKDESNMPGAFYISARTSADIGQALVGSPNGSLTWSGVSLTDGTFLTTRLVSTPNITSSTSNGIYITAPAVSGYQFLCWIGSSSEGGVYPTFMNQSRAGNVTGRVWWYDTAAIGSHIDCGALYIRKW